jgi:hypothetical protein
MNNYGFLVIAFFQCNWYIFMIIPEDFVLKIQWKITSGVKGHMTVCCMLGNVGVFGVT